MTQCMPVASPIVFRTFVVISVFVTPAQLMNQSLFVKEGESEKSSSAYGSKRDLLKDSTTTSSLGGSAVTANNAQNLFGPTANSTATGLSEHEATTERTTHRKRVTTLDIHRNDQRPHNSSQISVRDQNHNGTQHENNISSKTTTTDGALTSTKQPGHEKSTSGFGREESGQNDTFERTTLSSTTHAQPLRGLNMTDLIAMACSYKQSWPRESEEEIPFFREFGELEIDWCQETPQILKQVTAEICGVAHLCGSYPSRPGTDCEIECDSCRCDPSCHEYGDCCVDVRDPLNPEPDGTDTTCVEPGWTMFGTEPRARMVASCPTNLSNDSELRRSCESPDISIQDEATPVSDRNSSITYQNAFCARCNGVERFIPWTHRVTCQRASQLGGAVTEAELWEKVVNSDCEITTVSPNEIQVEHRCYPPSIGQCNVSRVWTGPNVVLMERLCDSYEHPVQYQTERYRNIFCAICNGIEIYLTDESFCPISDLVPFPLTVLLDFGPRDQPAKLPAYQDLQKHCDDGTVRDPFSKSCLSLKCQQTHVLRDGLCHHFLSSAHGLGFSVTLLPRRTSGRILLPDDLVGDIIFAQLEDAINNNFESVLIRTFQLRFFRGSAPNVTDSDRFLATLKIVLMGEMRFEELDVLFDTIESVNFITWTPDMNKVTFSTTLIHCPLNEDELLDDVIDVETFYQVKLSRIESCRLFDGDCLSNIHYNSPGTPQTCPFVEFNLTSQNLSFDIDSANISFGNKTLALNQSRLFHCGNILRVCSDQLDEMNNFFARTPMVDGVRVDVGPSPPDVALSLVSLVCLSFSLLGLLLTILVYSCLSKLRNLPGKITMMLVGHLFAAILLFLVGSNRQDGAILCQVFAVGIHYFWMTVFGWTMTAAYHMYRVFASLRVVTVGSGGERSRKLVRYFLICHFVSGLIIGGCIVYNYLRTDHVDIGYGGTVCFISEPLSIGVFFAAPLGIMLAFNTFCFIRTIFAIRAVPDMSNVSNSENRRYVFVYIKIALLFGFTWILGLIGPLVKSVIVEYAFVVLTGSQGVFIFIGYCLTGRAWDMLKQKLIPRKSLYVSGKTSLKSGSSKRNYEESTTETD